MTRRAVNPAKRPRGGSKPRLGAVASDAQILVKVTPAAKAAIESRAARTHGGNVSAHLRAGSELAASVAESVDVLIDAAEDRALTLEEDRVLLLLAPELRALARASGPLTSAPEIRRAG